MGAALTSPTIKAVALGSVRLAGSVVPIVARGQLQPTEATESEKAHPLTLTFTLRRSDQGGFEKYLSSVQSPQSPLYRHFLTQQQVTDEFGPSLGAYQAVLDWASAQGLRVTQGSKDRLTITVRATHDQAERAFNLPINEYQKGGKPYFANSEGPALPAPIAATVENVAGLSDVAEPAPPISQPNDAAIKAAYSAVIIQLNNLGVEFHYNKSLVLSDGTTDTYPTTESEQCMVYFTQLDQMDLHVTIPDYPQKQTLPLTAPVPKFTPEGIWDGSPPNWSNAEVNASANTDATQSDPRVGLLEFDTFNPSDISDFLSLIGANPTIAGQLSEVPVDGGVAAPGPDESEVLLDIEAAMATSEADPAVSYVVYDAPPSASFQQVFNAMINDGDNVISNSWSQCEDQTSLADAQSIDSILAQAAASGISVINGSGDGGSTCLDGSANTVGVPADSPNATAVGASTLLPGPGGTYGSESWWNGATDQSPETGAGGFGVSKYFTRPSYQDSETTSTGRSVPDLVVPADPGINGLPICQADNGGCPNNSLYGEHHLAAPE